MIKLTNVTKKFSNYYALQNINLTVDKHETVVIIGASGSGKSTLLRTINYLEVPTSGSVFIHGTKLTHKNHHTLCYKIGMVFQQFHLFPHMTVLQNLTYGPRNVLNEKMVNIIKKAQDLLSTFGIEDKLNSAPNDLSGGQKQKVAICRTLMMNPDVILFDEPTSALDPEVIKDVIQIIKNLQNQMTMVVITHQIKFAKIIANRIIFMDKGCIVADQPAREFFIRPRSPRARSFLTNIQSLI